MAKNEKLTYELLAKMIESVTGKGERKAPPVMLPRIGLKPEHHIPWESKPWAYQVRPKESAFLAQVVLPPEAPERPLLRWKDLSRWFRFRIWVRKALRRLRRALWVRRVS